MNVDAIFDAVIDAGRLVMLADKIRAKQQQIRFVLSKTCGNCDMWMKSTCVPEKKHKQFKSVASFACSAFELDSYSESAARTFGDELAVLRVRLTEAGAQKMGYGVSGTGGSNPGAAAMLRQSGAGSGPGVRNTSGCYGCVAEKYDDGNPWCGLDPNCRTILGHMDPPPDWCPLRAGPVVLRLVLDPVDHP